MAPKRDISLEELLAVLDEAGRKLNDARQLDAGTWFKHFAFGVFDRDKTIKFIRIHNRHHLRIISDIMAARLLDQPLLVGQDEPSAARKGWLRGC